MIGSETFVLELLPARGLDQSLLLPVLIGLFVVLLCTETFGWVFAGAVVPGYLASVLIVQPVTGAIVIWESLVTLAISAMLARVLSETDAWSRFFGRERFFLILTVSLIVRIHDHAWFARWAIATLDMELGTAFETQQEFYSVGLVLVPLTANMLWKPDIHRGLLQLGVQVAITYAIVAWILLPYTNLTLSDVELSYEDASLNFIGHAKAHIILLTAALLAARFNLSYGWDFNGILVPALLAMLWLTPLKLLATVGESIVVVHLVRGFVRLPVIRHLDFEGPRKITMVFTVAFVWKLVLGFALAPVFPELELRDAYGFGYLLSSLLAVKMLGCKSVRAVLLPSLTTAAGGFVLGSLAGLVLDLAAPQQPPEVRERPPTSARLATSPLGVMTLARVQIELETHEMLAPSQAELHQLQRLWAEVASLDAGPWSPATLDPVRRRAALLGLRVVELGRHASPEAEGARAWLGIVADDGPRRRGFATGLVIPGAEGPVLVVPRPNSEAPVAEAAALACLRLDCRAVLVAGRELHEPGTRINPRPLELALASFAAAPIVVLRADLARDPPSVLARAVPQVARARADASGPILHPLRGYLDLASLWPHYRLDWRPIALELRPPPEATAIVVVRTTPDTLEAMLLAGAGELIPGGRSLASPELETRGLLEVLGERLDACARPHDRACATPVASTHSQYIPPSAVERALLEDQVIEPLITWAQDPNALEPPATVGLWAAVLDYEWLRFGDCVAPDDRFEAQPCTILLRERSRPNSAGWGTLVVRRHRHSLAATIEVPRPQREPHSWRVATELWQVSRSATLVIGGADRAEQAASEPSGPERREPDEGAQAPNPDPVAPGNLGTPFQAFHQAIERASIRGGGHELIQLRGLAADHPVDDDLALGLGRPGEPELTERGCAALLDDRIAALIVGWGRCRVVDGGADMRGLSGAGTPQVEYSRELRGREVRVLWLSARLRERFRSDTGEVELRAVRQAGWEPSPIDPLAALLAPLHAKAASPGPRRDGYGPRNQGRPGFDRAVALALAHAETGNLHELEALRRVADSDPNLHVAVGLGPTLGRPFLILEWVGEPTGARALVELDHHLDGRVELSAAAVGADLVAAEPKARIEAAVLARPQLLILTEIDPGGLP